MHLYDYPYMHIIYLNGCEVLTSGDIIESKSIWEKINMNNWKYKRKKNMKCSKIKIKILFILCYYILDIKLKEMLLLLLLTQIYYTVIFISTLYLIDMTNDIWGFMFVCLKHMLMFMASCHLILGYFFFLSYIEYYSRF